ncbi:tri m 2 allergen [Colletotrichum chrysophilum]|uniref:Tri m 2 allergen n=1 Tax=Colletotrichum chrysophilum TaxID=1836956 RepID=A0AAD9A3Y5_9PEZI|nr:tri m 2 allergen [Colletotrichum chrysophilum]
MRLPRTSFVITLLMISEASALLPYSLPYLTPGKESRTAEPPPGRSVRFVRGATGLPSGTGIPTSQPSSSFSTHNTSASASTSTKPTSLASAGNSLPPPKSVSTSSSGTSFAHYSNSSSPTVAPSSGTTVENTATVTLTSATVTSTVTVVNLNGSPLPLDRPVVTYAPRGGSPITISSGSIALGSTTIAVPTKPTTLTADGTPITFGSLSTTQQVVTSVKQPPKTTKQETQESPTRTSKAVLTSSMPPSETSYMGEGNSPFDHTWVPLPVVVKLDGIEFYPPTEHEKPVEIFLKDGSTATLSYKSLKIAGKTVQIPQEVSSTSVIDGVEFSQRSFDSPEGSPGGGGGTAAGGSAGAFGAMKGIFEGLSGSAGPLADAVAGFSGKAMRLALNAPGGPLSGTQFGEAIELADLTQDAINLAKQTSQFQNQAESVRMNQGNQPDAFRSINGKFFSAYAHSRRFATWSSSTANMLQNLPNIPTAVHATIMERFGDLSILGMAALSFAADAYDAYAVLSAVNWADVDDVFAGNPQEPPNSTTVSQPTSTTIFADPPSKSGTPKKKASWPPIPRGPTDMFMITAKRGKVSTSVFKKFTKYLDNDAGSTLGAEEWLPTEMAWPVYTTNLTVLKAAGIAQIPWVRSVTLDIPFDVQEYERASAIKTSDFTTPITTPGSTPTRSPLYKRRPAPPDVRPNSPAHLRMISGDSRQDYRYHSSLGRGVTIFIIDTGFNLGHQELAPGSRKVKDYYVKNENAVDLSKVALDKLAPDNSEDYFHDGQRRIGHGTSVACVAGGTTLGVASNADLYLLKWKAAQKRNNGSYGPIQSRRVALIDAFNHIRAQILRANPSLKGKAVVNVSFGIKRDIALFDDIQADFEAFIEDLEELGGVFVMAAGNAAQSPSPDRLGDHLPQLLGTQENSLITVGGVHADGSLQATSEPEGKMKGDPPMQDGSPHPNANRRGSVTIYAQAEDVTGCIGDPADTRSTVKMTGNSFASPAVAGLAAYLLAHPDFSDVFEYKEKSQREPDYRSVGLQMKQVIEAFASFQWVPQEAVFNRFREYEREEYELPKRVRIAYNMVDGPKRDVDAATQPADPNRQRLRERYHRFLDRLQQCNPMKVKRDGTTTEIDFCSATDTFTRVSTTVPPTSMASTSTGEATLTFKPTTLTGSTSTTATSSPVLTCNEDSECDGLTCKSTEAKKCKAKSAVAGPIPIKQCECVDPKEEDNVPAVCTVDEDCKALACDAPKKKSCVTTIPMGAFAIRQCKCTDPTPTTTSVAKPTTVAPKPPSTTVKAPTPTSPALMECNLDQAVNSCAGYKNCRETERGICKEHKTDAGKHS